MTPGARRGACPSLQAPMQTGDGLLVRLGFRDGFTPAALAALAGAAERFGNGILEITARGNLQLRGLTTRTAPLLAAEVEKLALPLQTGLPVLTGSLAGLDPEETCDPRPLAEALIAAAEARGLAARLGPKVSVLVEGGGRFRLDEVSADIRLAAEGATLWRLSTGGSAGTAIPHGLFEETAAATAALRLLDRIAAKGHAARAGDLTCDEIADCIGLAAGAPAKLDPPPTPRERHQGPIGLHPLRSGCIAVGIGLPFGQARYDVLQALAEAATGHGAQELRLAPGRALLALCLSRQSAEELARMAQRLGFITNAADARLAVIACAGRPACASGFIDTKAIAAEIVAHSHGLFDETFPLHVSGCAKRCGGAIASGLVLEGAAEGAWLISGDSHVPPSRIAVTDAVSRTLNAAKSLRGKKTAHEGTARFAQALHEDSVADSSQPGG